GVAVGGGALDGRAGAEGGVRAVGCGPGFPLERRAGRGFSGVGDDLSPESVAIAERRLAEIGAGGGLRATVGSAYEPLEGPFDLVTITHAPRHPAGPRACLTAARARLAPAGPAGGPAPHPPNATPRRR